MSETNEQSSSPLTSAHGTTTRRDFLQASLAIAGTAAFSTVAPALAGAQTKSKRPNLVFFLGEGQRADALSIAGNPILKTPNHDRIGREGIRFTNAFCTNALCAPARATALTGMYSRSTGALDNTKSNIPLAADIPLFTEILQKEGYEVAIVGKIHTRNGFLNPDTNNTAVSTKFFSRRIESSKR